MELDRIKRNVAKMASMNAPEADIDGYIASEGATIDDIRSHKMTDESSQPADMAVANPTGYKPPPVTVTEIDPNAPAAPAPEQAKPGIIDRFTTDMKQRGADLANAVNATNMTPQGNQQTPGETIAQGALHNGVGGLASLGGAGIEALLKGAYNVMPKETQNKIDSDIQKISQVAAPIAEQYQQNQDAYDAANPRAGRNFQAVRELSNLIPLGAAPVRKVAGEVLDAGGSALKSAVAKSVPELTSAQRKVYSGALYDEADALGGALKPEARQKFRDEISKHADVGGEKLTSESSIFDDMLKATEPDQNKPLTLKTFETYDKKLTDLIHKERSITGISSEGHKLMELQDTLREMVDNPSPDMVTGGREGFDSLRAATKEYKLTKQQEEIERIIDYANKTDNPATSLKAQMRVLSRNRKRLAGYDPETRKLINKAAEDNKFADFLRTTAGSRLISGAIGGMVGAGGGAAVGGGLGAIPGAIGGAVTGMASRGAAKSIKTRQIKKIEKAIISKSTAEEIPRYVYDLPPEEAKKEILKLREQKRPNTSSQEVAQEIKPTLALPAPAPITVVNRQGVARTMTDSERQAAAQARQQAVDTGLTPDVRASQIRNQVTEAYKQRDLQRNAIKEEQIAKIAEQSSVPIEQLVDMADKNIEELSKIVGKKNSDTAFAQALRMAIRNKGKK